MRQFFFLAAIFSFGLHSSIGWAGGEEVRVRPIPVLAAPGNDGEIRLKSRQMEGEYLIASLETTLAKERLQVVSDKAELARLKVNLEYAGYWRNGALAQMVVGVPLGVLWARYGFKTDHFGHQVGGVISGAISGAFGSIGGAGFQAELGRVRGHIAAVETAIEERTRYLDDLQKKIDAIRSSLPRE